MTSLASRLGTYRYKLNVQYKGTSFNGWQLQPSYEVPGVTVITKDPKPKHTVQFMIEDAIYSFLGERANVYVAGRTDAGVHAISNCIHVDIQRKHKKTKEIILEPFDPIIVQKAINRNLYKKTKDVYITSSQLVSEDFHARFSVSMRTYLYRLVYSKDFSGKPFEKDTRWYLKKPVDIDLMRQACEVFLGTHDFSTFRNSCDTTNPVRTLSGYTVEYAQPPYPFPLSDNEFTYIDITFTARSFVYHQVRKMVAGVVGVGSRTITLAHLKSVLEARDSSKCPPMAPAHGLYLAKIEYPEHVLKYEPPEIKSTPLNI